MTDEPQHKPDAPPDDLRQLPLWTRRYALSRSLRPLVFLMVCAVGCAAFMGLGLLFAGAHRAGNMTAAIACGVLLAGFTLFWVWLSFAGLDRLLTAATTYLYRREGEVTVLPEEAPDLPAGAKTIAPRMVAVLLAAALAVALLSLWTHVPVEYLAKYEQPLAALIVTPFLVVLWALNRKAMNPTILLWPGLFVLHALPIVAGAPIIFTGSLRGLNIALPLVGYGLLAGLVGHLYNRHALARMRQLAGPEESDNGAEQP